MIIGGASFLGGRGNVLNAITGALIIAVMRNGFNLLGIDPNWQYMATGAVIVLAVELDVVRGQLESRFRSLQAAGAEAMSAVGRARGARRHQAVRRRDRARRRVVARGGGRGARAARRQRRREVDPDQVDQRCPSPRQRHDHAAGDRHHARERDGGAIRAGSRPSTRTSRCSTIWRRPPTSSPAASSPARRGCPRALRRARSPPDVGPHPRARRPAPDLAARLPRAGCARCRAANAKPSRSHVRSRSRRSSSSSTSRPRRSVCASRLGSSTSSAGSRTTASP